MSRLINGRSNRVLLGHSNTGVWTFLSVIITQTIFAIVSIYMLSAIRSCITAENIWIQAQQDAVYHLRLYVGGGDEQEFRLYQAAIAVPLAFDDAQRALTEPQSDRARSSLVRAGIQADDATRIVWLNHFERISFFKTSKAVFLRVNALTLEMHDLAVAIHDAQPWGNASTADPSPWLSKITAIADEVRPLVKDYSRDLGDGSRIIEWVLLGFNLMVALSLGALTVWRVRRSSRQRQMIERTLSWQASHDSLTGIANRRAFETALNDAVGRPHALMFLDLDQFKIVNDTCGHGAGDELLRKISVVLQDRLDGGGLLARLGGDEFSVLLSDGAAERAIGVAEELRAAVQDFGFVWGRRAFRLTASIGLVHSDGMSESEHTMREADMACFMAKEKGRNRVHVHRPEDQDLLRHAGEMNWVQRIHQALSEDQFCLYAQEIVPLAAGRDDGLHLELLIRLRDATGALIPPGTFLPAAERFGLMGLIDRWVVTAAFKVLAARRANPRAEPIACCAINLSGKTIGDADFRVFLEATFAEFRIPPEVICFEITETSAITNLDAAKSFVKALRALGCRFSLDDFGSGMSSFGYLKHLPVDFLKIDGGFVQNLLSDEVDRAMVEAINAIGHVMGKSIIAEFVETDALAVALHGIGVDYGQGYGIAKPKPFDLGFRSESAHARRNRVRDVA